MALRKPQSLPVPEPPARIAELFALLGGAAYIEAEASMNGAERAAASTHLTNLDAAELRAALSVIALDPDLAAGIRAMASRGRELTQAASLPGENTRSLTPVLAALTLQPRAQAMWAMAADRAVLRRSGALQERAYRGASSIRQLVVGSGWHAGVFSTESVWLNPTIDSLAIQVGPRFGGQYARAGAPVHGLNSRNRPHNPNLPHRPGTANGLNSMGPHALLQESEHRPGRTETNTSSVR